MLKITVIVKLSPTYEPKSDEVKLYIVVFRIPSLN